MGAHPIVWRAQFPKYMSASMVSWETPTGKVTNSDPELYGSVIHHVCMTHCYNVRERSTLYLMYNTSGMW